MAYETDTALMYSRLRLQDPTFHQEIRNALMKTAGNVLQAASLLGISHRTWCRWQVTFPELKRFADEARKGAVDPEPAASERSARRGRKPRKS